MPSSTWRADPSPSASLCERLNRGEPLALGTREQNLQNHSPAASESIPISWLCAHREERGQMPPKPLPFETLHGDRQLSFWGASTRLPNVRRCLHRWFLASSSRTTWQVKLDKDLDPQSAWEGMINPSPYCFTFCRLYMSHMFILVVSYIGINLSNLFYRIILWHVWCLLILVIW
jgi:hypothetical protein